MNNDAIGFVGTGRMGAPMAGHLLAAGEALVVHDVHPDAARRLVERGALWAASPAEVATRARTIITIVPSSREVEAIYAALLPKVGPGHLMLEMTTADPSSTRRLAKEVQARGAAMLDAPVSGGVRGAVEATLSIMVGGEAADLERARPILARLGKRAKEQGRPDDTPEVIGKRFDVYEEQTRPVVEHYTRKGQVRRVDGVGPIDEIGARLRNAAGDGS